MGQRLTTETEVWDLRGGFDGGDLEKINFLLSKGHDLAYAIEFYERVTFYEGLTLQQLAEQMVKEGRYGHVPERLRHVVNREIIAGHLKKRGYVETPQGIFAMESYPVKKNPRSLYIVFE